MVQQELDPQGTLRNLMTRAVALSEPNGSKSVDSEGKQTSQRSRSGAEAADLGKKKRGRGERVAEGNCITMTDGPSDYADNAWGQSPEVLEQPPVTASRRSPRQMQPQVLEQPPAAASRRSPRQMQPQARLGIETMRC
eukprot:symbB.v1.2.024840.t1/scaffold2377.1/size157712/6